MDKEKIDVLLKKYLDGDCVEEEKQLLELWFASQSAKGDWQWDSEEEKQTTANEMRAYLDRFYSKTPSKPSTYRSLVKAMAIAASFLLLASITFWLSYESEQAVPDESPKQALVDTLSTDGEVALLLADGSTLSIGHIGAEDPYKLGEKTVQRVASDELILANNRQGGASKTARLASLIVPKGKTFKLTLEDGTKIWVNTASTLSFPSENNANERKVILEDGEAYFEVAKDINRPFVVKASGMDILVLGTSFNVNAYKEDDKVVTTLVEGSVKLSNGVGTTMLKPNQQAVGHKKSNEIIKKEVDIDNILAWQKDYFVFDNQDIRAIMRDVSRWYDVDVSYEGAISKKKFGGTFSKAKSIDELLSYLESINGNLRFKQIGRRVIVMS
ncbi:FecR family protein [Olivibacter sitiensis]|uniref:FecR family protein n=1 Tax=Olivibacter sitiensis TaxID=376470 RepID=UPI00042272B4|nr:FecR domain-containing protein [Olivibacter sitiensis]